MLSTIGSISVDAWRAANVRDQLAHLRTMFRMAFVPAHQPPLLEWLPVIFAWIMHEPDPWREVLLTQLFSLYFFERDVQLGAPIVTVCGETVTDAMLLPTALLERRANIWYPRMSDPHLVLSQLLAAIGLAQLGNDDASSHHLRVLEVLNDIVPKFHTLIQQLRICALAPYEWSTPAFPPPIMIAPRIHDESLGAWWRQLAQSMQAVARIHVVRARTWIEFCESLREQVPLRKRRAVADRARPLLDELSLLVCARFPTLRTAAVQFWTWMVWWTASFLPRRDDFLVVWREMRAVGAAFLEHVLVGVLEHIVQWSSWAPPIARPIARFIDSVVVGEWMRPDSVYHEVVATQWQSARAADWTCALQQWR